MSVYCAFVHQKLTLKRKESKTNLQMLTCFLMLHCMNIKINRSSLADCNLNFLNIKFTSKINYLKDTLPGIHSQQICGGALELFSLKTVRFY